MALVFHRSLAVPLWAVAFFAVTLAAPARPIPTITVLLGIAVLALTMMAMVAWRRRDLTPVHVRPLMAPNPTHAGIIMTAGTRVWTVDSTPGAPASDDALDLVRMDDDGWQMASAPKFPRALIPGAREPGMLTTFETSPVSPRISEEPSTMDATTIAERQREGGGAPSQRRPARERSWPALGHSARQFVTATRALYARRVRTNHV